MVEVAEFVARSKQPRPLFAMKLYAAAFAAEPDLANDTGRGLRYNAACCAVLAATGQDKELVGLGIDEWGYLTDLAIKWLRADLNFRLRMADNPSQRQEVRMRLAYWKKDPDLLPVRDPARLGAMPTADRREWESLWADVDAAIAALSPAVAPQPRAKP